MNEERDKIPFLMCFSQYKILLKGVRRQLPIWEQAAEVVQRTTCFWTLFPRGSLSLFPLLLFRVYQDALSRGNWI